MNGSGRLRSVIGICYLLWPDQLAGLVVSGPRHHRSSWVIRILGARQIAQAILTTVLPKQKILKLGALVDSAHAASMFALGLISARWRRAGFIDATVASAFAVLGAKQATEGANAPNEAANDLS